MMSTSWRDKQRPDLVNFIATFLATNLYRLNFLSLSPVRAPIQRSHWFWCVTVHTHGFDWVGLAWLGFQDFLFNNGGLSVAFIFETDWLPEREAALFSRSQSSLCVMFVVMH